MLSLSFAMAAAMPAMKNIIPLQHKPITATKVSGRTELAARPNSSAMLFGIPITRLNNTITSITSGAGNSKKPAGNSTVLKKPTTLAVHADHADPIPEYDDPGYRVRCSDQSDSTREDHKEAFKCWFYHRTRCFGGVLTSLDPACIHDCGCEHSTYDLYDRETKGNHGAGMAGVCVVLPVPEYSPEDGGCV